MKCMRRRKNGTEKKYSLAYLVRKIIPRVVKADPKIYLLIYLSFALTGILGGLEAPALQKLFDEAVIFASAGNKLSALIGALLLVLAVKLLGQLFGAVANFYGEAYDIKAYEEITGMLQEKTAMLHADEYENAAVLNEVEKAYSAVWPVVDFNNTFMDIMLYYVPYLAVMFFYLILVEPLLVFAFLIVFLSILTGQYIKAGANVSIENHMAPLRREIGHYQECLSKRKYLKETRTIGAGSFFAAKLKRSIDAYSQLKKEKNRDDLRIEFLTDMVCIAEYGLILLLLILLLMKGKITVAAFAVVLSSVDSLFTWIENLINYRVSRVTEDYSSLAAFVDFFRKKDKTAHRTAVSFPAGPDICAENLCFRYPGADRDALKGISFHVKAGETIAVVGQNGSGKSTLVKLLLGLYPIRSGTLRCDGQIYDERTQRLSNVSAAMQDYNKYAMTVRQNIELSEPEKEKDGQAEKLLRMVELGELDLDEKLGVEFGGEELSGGKWQRLAIARALYRENRLLVLDEPTASIDPLEEIKLYELFREVCKGKTSFIVTHRLGSVKFADRIMVMDEGQIAAFDTHEALLQSCSLYRQMWDSV